jgi:hypothetical protein
MYSIIQPIDRKDIKKELTEYNFLRETNNGRNKIFIITANDSPMVMREIGRLRELTFRAAGGGTGKEIDIDDFDLGPNSYRQLIVWNPEDEQIVGGYRFIKCKEANKTSEDKYHLATSELFNFSQKFIDEYFPFTIELGRSFVQPFYQPSVNKLKGIFSLDNIWDGLGALIIDNPDVRYFFGKVTMYSSYNSKARDMVLFFLYKHFPDREKLVIPINPIEISTPLEDLEEIFTGFDYKEDYKILFKNVRKYLENIPPLINSYMNLSPTMKTFGTALNHEFGGVEETGILIKIEDIYHSKKERHVASYLKQTLNTLQNIRKYRGKKLFKS